MKSISIYFLEILKKELNSQLQKILSLTQNFEVIEAHSKTGADLAVPLFRVAKELKINPNELASTLTKKLSLPEIQKIEPAGGFLNIWLKPQSLAQALTVGTQNVRDYGQTSEGINKLIIVDYVGLNMAKPFSVGHLRPALQGQALINLFRKLGYKVLGDTHLGDSGTPFGIWVVGFKLLSSEAKTKRGWRIRTWPSLYRN
jgi:arginyl-tRNA synthetase